MIHKKQCSDNVILERKMISYAR